MDTLLEGFCKDAKLSVSEAVKGIQLLQSDLRPQGGLPGRECFGEY